MKEMKIFNVEISGVEQSLIASGYPMNSSGVTEYGDAYEQANLIYSPYNETVYKLTDNRNNPVEKVRSVSKIMKSLANAKSGSGHDCFLKGINVSFDISYPVYWSPQFQRYHFADIVSST